MPPRTTKAVPRQTSPADYQSFDDDYNRPADANALPFARALLFITVLFTAATILAIFAQVHRAALPPPAYNESSSSSSSSSSGGGPGAPIASSSSSSSSSSGGGTGTPTPLVSSSSSSSSSSSGGSISYNGTVHVVFSNHLDIGFADTSANIVNEYFDTYFPAAVNFTETLRSIKYADSYTWMTHSYLLSLYFDCPPNMGLHCPTAAQQAAVQAAIQRGDISWHAWPFNSEMELHTIEMVEAGIQLSTNLSATLGRVGGAPTVMSQRDVPGTTIGVIPTLVKNGIRAFSIGANGAAAPANVSRVNLWKLGDQSVYLLFHPGNYGGIGVTDSVVLPGFNHVLIMDWRTDNSGPITDINELTQNYNQIRAEFPGYNVIPSTFESYIDELDKAVQANTIQLPVVTSEIGGIRQLHIYVSAVCNCMPPLAHLCAHVCCVLRHLDVWLGQRPDQVERVDCAAAVACRVFAQRDVR